MSTEKYSNPQVLPISALAALVYTKQQRERGTKGLPCTYNGVTVHGVMKPNDTQQFMGRHKHHLNLKIYLIMVTVLTSSKPHSHFQAPWSSWTPYPTVVPLSQGQKHLGLAHQEMS